MGKHRRRGAAAGDSAASAEWLDADRRTRWPPLRTSRACARRVAVPAAILPGCDMVATDSEALRRRAWDAAASVVDPEIPVLNIADLGVLRAVAISNGAV